jgi:hypothetical protein
MLSAYKCLGERGRRSAVESSICKRITHSFCVKIKYKIFCWPTCLIPYNPLFWSCASKSRVIPGVDPAFPRVMQEVYPSGKRPQLFGTRTPIATNGPPAAARPCCCWPARVGARRGVRSTPKWLNSSVLNVLALSRLRPALPSSQPVSRRGKATRQGRIASICRPDHPGSCPRIRMGATGRCNGGNTDPRKRNITLNIWMRRVQPPSTKSNKGTPCHIGAFVVYSSGDALIRPLRGGDRDQSSRGVCPSRTGRCAPLCSCNNVWGCWG